jgi:hypothetical protein
MLARKAPGGDRYVSVVDPTVDPESILPERREPVKPPA